MSGFSPRKPAILAVVVFSIFFASLVAAEPTETSEPSSAEAPTRVSPVAPYSLPFQLRSVAPATAVRLDTAIALYTDPATRQSGSTDASVLSASVKVTDEIAVLARLGMVRNEAPGGLRGFAFTNPLLGAAYALKPAPSLRLASFVGIAPPFGSPGGNRPLAGNALALAAGNRARSGMDGALFATNDVALLQGLGIALVAEGLTVQGEATLIELVRARGENAQPDAFRVNLTSGVHVGYFLVPALSFGVELRHQRWLSTPRMVDEDARHVLRDTSTAAFGLRLHLGVSDGVWMRPALALAVPLDDPLADASYRIVTIDVPVVF